MLAVFFGEARVIEDEPGPAILCLQLKLNDRIDTVGPHADMPRLNDSLVRHEFDDSPHNLTTKTLERTPGFALNFRWKPPAEGAEMLGVSQCLVNPLRARLEINFLMDWVRHSDGSFHFVGFAKYSKRRSYVLISATD